MSRWRPLIDWARENRRLILGVGALTAVWWLLIGYAAVVAAGSLWFAAPLTSSIWVAAFGGYLQGREDANHEEH